MAGPAKPKKPKVSTYKHKRRRKQRGVSKATPRTAVIRGR